MASFARALDRAFDEHDVTPPAESGHALVYATAGEFTSIVARREALPDHQPFWIRQDFERLPDWAVFGPAIRQHWLPVVRGEADVGRGLSGYVRAIGN